jgi:hypothetical protein
MGVVYKARHLQLNRLVALKMVLAAGHASAAERNRFRQEAETVARLQHPNIVQIFEVGAHNGLPYLALEYVDGGTLAQQKAGHPMAAQTAAALVALLARAVDYAHQNGVIHREKIELVKLARLALLTGHTGWVGGVVFSPDGQRLATSSADQTIKVCDLRPGPAPAK